MSDYDILVGAILVGVGLLIGSASSLSVLGEQFVDEYPNGGDWGAFGNFSNSLSDVEQRLVIEDTNQEVGTFESDRFSRGTNFDFDRITYEAD